MLNPFGEHKSIRCISTGFVTHTFAGLAPTVFGVTKNGCHTRVTYNEVYLYGGAEFLCYIAA